VRKLIAGLVVVSSGLIGAGVASATTSGINSEKTYMASQVENQLQVGLKWKACSSGSSHGQCARTDGGERAAGGILTLGAYSNGVTLELTGAKDDNSNVAEMAQATRQITLHYAGRKAVQWLSGLKPPFGATSKSFGPWTVQANESNSNHGTATLVLTGSASAIQSNAASHPKAKSGSSKPKTVAKRSLTAFCSEVETVTGDVGTLLSSSTDGGQEVPVSVLDKAASAAERLASVAPSQQGLEHDAKAVASDLKSPNNANSDLIGDEASLSTDYDTDCPGGIAYSGNSGNSGNSGGSQSSGNSGGFGNSGNSGNFGNSGNS